MSTPRGALIITDPAQARPVEIDCFTCCHCQCVIWLHDELGRQLPQEETYRMCLLCMKPKCPACFGKGCEPFEKKLERAEARDALLRAMGG